MESKLSLLDVCKLPDVQIHSRAALFKSAANQESLEMTKLRDNIVKLSYTTKTIGVKNEEIGIYSKRIPLKSKQKLLPPDKQLTPAVLPLSRQSQYIPHRSFYVTPLITVKKKREKEEFQDESIEQVKAKKEEQKMQGKKIIQFEKTTTKSLLKIITPQINNATISESTTRIYPSLIKKKNYSSPSLYDPSRNLKITQNTGQPLKNIQLKKVTSKKPFLVQENRQSQTPFQKYQ